MHIYNLENNEEYALNTKEYNDASKKINEKGQWTNFYRNATNEKKESAGKHEIKSFKLKTFDKRKIDGK